MRGTEDKTGSGQGGQGGQSPDGGTRQAGEKEESPGWAKHEKREAARLRAALAALGLAAAVMGGFWLHHQNSRPVAAPPTEAERLGEMARKAGEDGELALGDRSSKAVPRPLGEMAPPLKIVAPSAMPSGAGTMAPARAAPRVVPVVAPVSEPDSAMLAAQAAKLGKPVLGVDANGMATLPDGTRVAIAGAPKAQAPALPESPPIPARPAAAAKPPEASALSSTRLQGSETMGAPGP